MPDIGFGEILVIVVLALLVFGPDRLPKVAADAARTLRQVRQMAATARKDLVDASGLEDDGEMAQTVRDIRDLDPRRAMQGVLTDDPVASSPNGGKSAAAGAPAARAAGASARAASGGSSGGANGNGAGNGTGKPAPAAGSGTQANVGGASSAVGAAGSAGHGRNGGTGSAAGTAEGEPLADPVVDAAPVDPDWT